MASMNHPYFLRGAVLLLLLAAWPVAAQEVVGPVRVTIRDEQKTEAVETLLPIDPQNRCAIGLAGNMAYGLHVDGKRLCFATGSITSAFKIDGRPVGGYRPFPGRFEVQQVPLKP